MHAYTIWPFHHEKYFKYILFRVKTPGKNKDKISQISFLFLQTDTSQNFHLIIVENDMADI